jgi:asparagine synthetase B (glutamine-hydrolysing)
MLRPMANVFAVSAADPELLRRIEARLTGSGEFDVVWRPAPGWLAAQAPLPESADDGDAVRSEGLAFFEGRDRLEGEGADWLRVVTELADGAPDRLDNLPGDFGSLRFRTDGSAVAVRSCGGVVPVYLQRRDGGGFALGTLLNYFPRFLPDSFLPDPLVNTSWDRTPLRFIDGRTFIDGVSILPRGSYTELAPRRAPKTRTYWDPRPKRDEGPSPGADHSQELRKLLIDTLSRGLDPAGRNLLLLSGGVDSSALGALAAGTLGYRMSSWSLIPPADPERARDLSYIEPLVSQFQMEPAHKRELTEEVHRRWITEAPGLPFQVIHPALCDLPSISSRQEVRVLLSGMFADEVCGHRQRLGDWARSTSLWALATGAPLPFGRRNYLGWARRRLVEAIGRPRLAAMELPGWRRDEVAAEYREWVDDHRRALARDDRPLRDLATRADADAWVAMYWEGAAPLGIRPLLPFFNREVLELAFKCHPSELLGPGPKRLLREALREDVPARNLLRPDRGLWDGHHNKGCWEMNGALPAVAAQLGRPDWLPSPPPDMPFVDGYLLTAATRVAEYLAVQGSPKGE